MLKCGYDGDVYLSIQKLWTFVKIVRQDLLLVMVLYMFMYLLLGYTPYG